MSKKKRQLKPLLFSIVLLHPISELTAETLLVIGNLFQNN